MNNRNRDAGNGSIPDRADKMGKELLCGFTGFAVNSAENNSFVGLTVQDDCSIMRSKDREE